MASAHKEGLHLFSANNNNNNNSVLENSSSFFIDDIDDIALHKNDETDDDDSSLSEKSVLSNIFDEEESIVVDPTSKATFSSFSSTMTHDTTISRTNNIKKGTSFVGQEANGEIQEHHLIRSNQHDMGDVLNSVTMLLDGTTKDDFSSNFTNNTTSQQGLVYSNYKSFLSSIFLIEPTPISTEPGRIQVIPKISSLVAASSQEGASLLSKNWCSPSNTTTASKGLLLWNGDDCDHDIRDHVIKTFLSHQLQNSSSPSRHHTKEKVGDKVLYPITEDDLPPRQIHSSSFTSKKRSISREWDADEDNNEGGDELWFDAIDGNTTPPCSKMEHISKNESIFVRPPPSRKKSRVDGDSDTSLYPSEYLEKDNSPNNGATTTKEENNNNRFRIYQAEQWWQRLHDLIEFQKTYGHCNVPNAFSQNPILAQWVKRQRYQYKLKQEGKHSTLTDEREAILQNMGFIWDSHGALWAERWNELKAFYDKVGHSNVPTHYEKNRQLAIWVKCQRRQYKLYVAGDPKSNMTVDRINKLELLDFVWHPKVGAKSAKEKEQCTTIL